MSPSFILFTALLGQTALDRNPATVSDSYALEANPAGLAFMSDSEMRILSGSPMGQTGLNMTSLRAALVWPGQITLAGSASWAPDAEGEITFYSGFGGGLRLGASTLGLSWGQTDQGDIWRLGYGLRPYDWLSTSVSTMRLSGKETPKNVELGLGIRPWASDRVTVSTRWKYSDGLGLNSDDGRPDIEFRVDVEPFDGIYLGASSDMHANAFLELGLALDQLSINSALHLNKDSTKNSWLIDVALHGKPRKNLFEQEQVIVVDLSGDLRNSSSFDLLGIQFDRQSSSSFPVMIDELSKAEQVAGLFLKIGRLEIGWAKASELRRSISRVRQANKRVDCYLFDGTDLAYFVASACDKIIAPPSLILNIDGLTADASFFADTLQNVGVEVNVVAAGKYKSAPEQFVRTGMSLANREAVTALVDTLYKELTTAIVDGRKLKPETVEALIREGTQTSTEAKSAKLIDHVAYSDEVERYVRQQYTKYIEISRELSANSSPQGSWGGLERIAIINIDAQITGGKSQSSPLQLSRSSGAQTIIQAVEKARRDASIRAVVLRINSPGGDAFASDLIARSIRELAKVKPVIASFGDVAASGGYYAAAAAHAIYAEPTTITGSIGVFSIDISTEGLRRGLGINVERIQRGSPSQRSSILVRPSEAERKRAQKEVSAIYSQFIQVVAAGRGMKPQEVQNVAQGRVWTGLAAKKRGLVDHLGSLADALRRAKREAGLGPDEQIEVVQLPRPKRGLLQLLGMSTQISESEVIGSLIDAFSLNHWAEILKSGASTRIMAQMPYTLEIN